MKIYKILGKRGRITIPYDAVVLAPDAPTLNM